jgi:hypothetical protein
MSGIFGGWASPSSSSWPLSAFLFGGDGGHASLGDRRPDAIFVSPRGGAHPERPGAVDTLASIRATAATSPRAAMAEPTPCGTLLWGLETSRERRHSLAAQDCK